MVELGTDLGIWILKAFPGLSIPFFLYITKAVAYGHTYKVMRVRLESKPENLETGSDFVEVTKTVEPGSMYY